VVEREQLEELAEEIFALTQMDWAARPQVRRRPEHDISESEFLSLDALARSDSMTVGELQKRVGVLPAQMSRIVRSLENKPDEAMISCAINPTDKRKIDVSITEAGRKAVTAYRSAKLAGITEVLTDLSESDRAEFIRILRVIRTQITERSRHGSR